MRSLFAAIGLSVLALPVSGGVFLLEDRNAMTGGVRYTAMLRESAYNAASNSHTMDLICREDGRLDVRWYLDSPYITGDQARRTVQWRVDDGPVRSGRMSDLGPHLDALRRGAVLYVRMPEGTNYSFPLKGSTAALAGFAGQCGL